MRVTQKTISWSQTRRIQNRARACQRTQMKLKISFFHLNSYKKCMLRKINALWWFFLQNVRAQYDMAERARISNLKSVISSALRERKFNAINELLCALIVSQFLYSARAQREVDTTCSHFGNTINNFKHFFWKIKFKENKRAQAKRSYIIIAFLLNNIAL